MRFINAGIAVVLIASGTLVGQFSITSLSPPNAIAGGAPFTLVLTGNGFSPLNRVEWDGATQSTTFVSATSLSIPVTSAMLTAGNHTVQVRASFLSQIFSNTANFVVGNAVPVLTLLSPSSRNVNTPAFSLAVTGTGFVTGATLQFDLVNMATTVNSSTLLTATIPATSLTLARLVAVRVVNPAPTVGFSAPLTFTVTNPTPSISAISPTTLLAGGPAFTLTVTGNGFTTNSILRVNGSGFTPTSFGSNSIAATIPASFLATGGTLSITVQNLAPGGGTSASSSLFVNNPVPTLTSAAPDAVVAGGTDVVCTLAGTGFVTASAAELGFGTVFVPLATTVVGSTAIQATIPTATLALGTRTLRVRNPTPAGGTSALLNILVVPAAPTLTSITPNPITQAFGGTAISLQGSGFHSGCAAEVVGFGPIPTTFSTPSLLQAIVPPQALQSSAPVSLRVLNTLSGGLPSGALTLNVVPLVPVVGSISPDATAFVSSQGGVLSIAGSGFLPGAEVRIDGIPISVSSLTASTLGAAVLPNTITHGGSHALTVVNVGPHGGTSIPVTVGFTNPVPVITSVPSGLIQGGTPSATVTLGGTGFCGDSSVVVAGLPCPVTSVAFNSLSFTVSGTRLNTARFLELVVANAGPGGGATSPQNLGVAGPLILVLQPSSSPVLTPASLATPVAVRSFNLTPNLVVHFDGIPLPTGFVDSTQLNVLLPFSLPGMSTPGSHTITVLAGNTLASNGLVFNVGTAPALDNAGTVRFSPLPPAPGAAFSVVVEAPFATGAPYTLIADLSQSTTLIVSPVLFFDLAVGVGFGTPLALADGLGVFGPPQANAVFRSSPASLTGGIGGVISYGAAFLDDLVAPLPAIGLPVRLQALWVDSNAPTGFNVTSVCGPHTL